MNYTVQQRNHWHIVFLSEMSSLVAISLDVILRIFVTVTVPLYVVSGLRRTHTTHVCAQTLSLAYTLTTHGTQSRLPLWVFHTRLYRIRVRAGLKHAS